MQKLFYLLIILFAITSCTKEVKIDIPGFEEQLVIDGSIETTRYWPRTLNHARNFASFCRQAGRTIVL